MFDVKFSRFIELNYNTKAEVKNILKKYSFKP